jgi:hypothetical protein
MRFEELRLDWVRLVMRMRRGSWLMAHHHSTSRV